MSEAELPAPAGYFMCHAGCGARMRVSNTERVCRQCALKANSAINRGDQSQLHKRISHAIRYDPEATNKMLAERFSVGSETVKAIRRAIRSGGALLP